MGRGSHGVMGHGIESSIYDYTWVFIVLLGLLLIIGIVFLALWLFRHSDKARNRYREENTLEILRKRYARGEIDKEEFEQRKRSLGSSMESDKDENALEILERRYSLGEIDQAEFEQKRKDILD